jgi:predicted nucleotide-binding protein (sugar kinase/HSP70/actin superfamily)
MDHEPAEGSAFRGFDLANRKIDLSSFECDECSNSCEIRTVSIEGEKPLTYGSRCGKFDEEKRESLGKDLPRLFVEREKMLLKKWHPTAAPSPTAPTIGIPRSLLFYEMYPFWQTFFGELGFNILISPPSTKKIVNQGCEAVVEEVCFPIKVGMGHVLELLKKEPDYIFLPCVVNADAIHTDACGSSICPLVQGFPYMSDAALDFSRYPSKIIRPVFHFESDNIHKELQSFAKELGFTGSKAGKAIELAFASLKMFRASLLSRGREVLENLPTGVPSLVIVSRPYNGCDPGLNLRIPDKLRDMGVLAIPVDFLPIVEDAGEHIKTMYWRYGQRILSAAELIARNPGLNALYITNFACGPDSFILKYFNKVMKGKQMLTLELDEHSADAGVITRLEAFLDSLDTRRNLSFRLNGNGNGKGVRKDFSGSRKIYIPHIDDHGRGTAAAVRYYGLEAEALPMTDDRSMEIAKQYTTGKECYPFQITTGDILKKAAEKGFEAGKASFFMPTTNGPCRFGQYCHSHQLILEEAGLGDALMITVDQSESMDDDLKKLDSGFRILLWQVFVATDNIKKLLYQTRPYEIQKGQTDQVYEECLKYLEQMVEKHGKVKDSVEHALRQFERIAVDRSAPRPIIGLIGEIFVRSNDYSNNFIIRQIEELGGEVVVAHFPGMDSIYRLGAKNRPPPQRSLGKLCQ